MKKLDVMRMIAAMPDETIVCFDNAGVMIDIESAEYKDGKLMFRSMPSVVREKKKDDANQKVLPE